MSAASDDGVRELAEVETAAVTGGETEGGCVENPDRDIVKEILEQMLGRPASY